MHCSLEGGHGFRVPNWDKLRDWAMWQTEAEVETKAVESRALVVLEASETFVARAAAHPSAEFVTQLLAVKAGLPQTRERRRAEPDEALNSYEMSMAPRPVHTGRVLSRAM